MPKFSPRKNFSMGSTRAAKQFFWSTRADLPAITFPLIQVALWPLNGSGDDDSAVSTPNFSLHHTWGGCGGDGCLDVRPLDLPAVWIQHPYSFANFSMGWGGRPISALFSCRSGKTAPYPPISGLAQYLPVFPCICMSLPMR